MSLKYRSKHIEKNWQSIEGNNRRKSNEILDFILFIILFIYICTYAYPYNKYLRVKEGSLRGEGVNCTWILQFTQRERERESKMQ